MSRLPGIAVRWSGGEVMAVAELTSGGGGGFTRGRRSVLLNDPPEPAGPLRSGGKAHSPWGART